MKNYLFLFCFFAFYGLLPAQNISAYSDYKNYFYVFDNGVSKELEYLPVKWYKVGKNAIAYFDNSDNFKAYYQGNKFDLAFSAPSDCQVTDDFIVYFFGKTLKIFDKGDITLLSGWTTTYVIGDSIVGCLDQNTYTYQIYYHGNIFYLPDFLDDNSLRSFRAGDNLLAYISNEGFLKIYYKGRIFNTEASQSMNYKAAANTVAFVNEATQEFNVFYKGNLSVLDNFPPRTFVVADDMVAYVDNSGSFKVFYQGKITELSSYAPLFYDAEDNILVYGDNVNFKVFYKGTSYTLERYIPGVYKKDFNTLVYQDSEGYLNTFSDGKIQKVCNEKVASWDLFGNTIKFINSMNEVHFFVAGNIF
ncbi:MAG: hypothetical protein HY840_04785 [Bacteroidetes bacterium]|nr:hypothetical protein [Bacteroidota bacterium]